MVLHQNHSSSHPRESQGHQIRGTYVRSLSDLREKSFFKLKILDCAMYDGSLYVTFFSKFKLENLVVRNTNSIEVLSIISF